MKPNIKSFIKRILLIVSIFGLLLMIGINTIREKKIENKYNSQNLEGAERRHKSKYRSIRTFRSLDNPPVVNTTNITLQKTLNLAINNSLSNVDLNTFKESNKNFKFHSLFDKQLEELFFIFKTHKMAGVEDFRSAYNLFIKNFNACDKDKDNFINPSEFINCMKNDPYLSLIMPTEKLYANDQNNTATPLSFYQNLFLFVDNYDKHALNLYDYVLLRLIAFSWRKCSVNGPFMDESSFECAINIISQTRSLSSTSLRKLFELARDLSNSRSIPVRTIDFISYYAFSTSTRLFGQINSKEDMDATKNEFNLALDNNILPTRFNQIIINDLFKLIKSSNSAKGGIDLYSFCFYDHFLRMFYQGFDSENRWSITLREFNILHGLFLFPNFFLNYLKQVPLYNYTADSYHLRRHINPSQLSEDDHFMKFLELQSKFMTETARHNNTNYDQQAVLKRIFTLLDSDEDEHITFFDFGIFLQTFYLYNKIDIHHKDRLLVGEVYNSFTEHFDLPLVSEKFRESAKRFSMLEQDTYIDPFFTLVIIRLNDSVSPFVRKGDPTTVKEIELLMILDKISLKNFPLKYLKSCTRGNDQDGIPKYDWECSVIKAIQKTLTYLENIRDISDTKKYSLNLAYTVIDSADS